MRLLPVVWRIGRAERAMLAALALLILLTAFLAAAVPCALTGLFDRAVREAARSAPAGTTDLAINGTLTRQAGVPRADGERPAAPGSLSDGRGLREAEARWRAGLRDPLRSMITPIGYEARSRYVPSTDRADADRYVGDQEFSLSWTAGVAQRVRYVAGRPPRPPRPGDDQVTRFAAGKARVVEVGLAARTASAMRIEPGDTLLSAPGQVPGLAMRVTGIYQPTDPHDHFWRHWPALTAPAARRLGTEVIFGATGLMHHDALAMLERDTDIFLEYTWRYETDLGRLRAAHTGALADGVRNFDTVVARTVVDTVTFRLTTGIGPLLDDMTAQLRAARAVLLVALAGLLGAALGVLVLALRLVLVRLRRALGTMRARGGGLGQLALVATGTVALAALPATAVGTGAALILPIGPYVPVAAWGPAAVLAVALGLPAVLTAWSHRWPDPLGSRADRSGTSRRPAGRSPGRANGRKPGRWGRPRGRPGARVRLVVEALAVTLALTGTFLLRQRGLADAPASGADAGQADPFLVAVPVLLGLAAGLVALRVYPYPLRALGRLAARHRSAVPFIGIAAAARGAGASALPLVVVLLAMSSAAFGAAIDTGLDRAQRLAAWQRVGADVRVDDIDPLVGGFDGQALARIRRVPGVEATATARTFEDQAQLVLGSGKTHSVRVVAVDPAAYRSVLRGSPLPAPPALAWDGRGPAPALLSAPVAASAGGAMAGGRAEVSLNLADSVTVRPVGRIGAFAGLPAGESFIVLPSTVLTGVRIQEQRPTSVFVRGDVDAAALRAAAGGTGGAGPALVTVTERAGVYRAIRDLPLVTGVRTAFLVGALVIACYCVMTVLLILIAGAPARGALVAYLRTLGLGRAQARRLTLIELVPPVAVAALLGFALGAALPAILGPGLDLTPYTGGTPLTGLAVDPVTAAVLLGGLGGSVAIGVLAEALIRRTRGTRRARPGRSSPAGSLGVGEA